MDYLYGELNQNLVNLANYKGLDNGDARVLVDNTERTIGVDLGGLKDTIASSYVSTAKDQEVGGTKTFTDGIAVVGTTKLGGGFEPIKSYTVNADYRGTQTTLVLNVFTENYVESSKMYSFFGSASATALGVGEFICHGSYRLDTNGNLDGAVLLTTMKQDIGSLIMACQYEDGQLIAVGLAGYDDIESVQTWANGTFAQLRNPNNFTGSSNVFNGNLITNGTLKLKGGFEPLKTYTMEGRYGERTTTATLSVFSEKSMVLPSTTSTRYTFQGSINTPILGGDAIGEGMYILDANNDVEVLVFVNGTSVFSYSSKTFKTDSLEQKADIEMYVERYVEVALRDALSGAIEKDDSGTVVVGLNSNSGITVSSGTGNVAIGKNLEVGGNVFTLKGKQWGIMPVIKINVSGNYAEEGFILSDALPSVEEGLINVSGIWYSADRNDVIGLCPAKTNFPKKSNKTRIENGILYVDVTDIDTLLGLFPYIVTESDLPDLSELQSQLYRHVIKLSGTDSSGYTYTGIIIVESPSNLKVSTSQDLTTLLKPTDGFEYPLSGVVYKQNVDLVTELVPINIIQFEFNVWKFYDAYSNTVDITSVIDTVTSL